MTCEIHRYPAMAEGTTPCVPALYAFLLGSIFSGSLFIAILKRETFPNLSPFSVHLSSLALFHFLEYFWQAKYHPKTTTSEGTYQAIIIFYYYTFYTALFFSILIKS